VTPDPAGAVELRIHGVGGSTPEALLGEDHAHAVEPVPGAGDRRCGVWARVSEPNTQGFVWGPLTSQSPFQALWIVLFPFTLLNAAGWMHGRVAGEKDPDDGPDLTVTAVRLIVRVLGLTLSALWVLWLAVILVDLLAHQAARDVEVIDPEWRAILSTVSVAAVMGALCVVAGLTQKSFERQRPSFPEAWSPEPGPARRRINDHENLYSRSFFDHAGDSRRLLIEHGLVIGLVVLLVGWRALQRAGDEGSLAFGGGITGLVAVQFGLVAALFLLTVLPLDWRRGWRVAGPAMAATVALMLSNGFFAGVALTVRRSLKIKGPPGSEMAFLDVYSLVVAATLLFTVFGWAVPYLLGRDDADDAPEAWRKRVGRRRRMARAFRHVDLPVTVGASGMLLAGTAVALRRIERPGWNPWDWSVGTGGRVPWAETAGAFVLPAAAMLVPALIRKAAGSQATRRNVGNVWDVLSFWPRRFHPLAVRPYSERAVPILQEHIVRLLERHPRVVVSAHSQGSVLAYAALAGLCPPGESDGSWSHRIHLVTYGSPLSRLHGRFFPHYFSLGDYVKLRRDLGSWHNFYRLTDHIGQAVFDATDAPDPCDHILPDPAEAGPAGDQPESPPLERDLVPGAAISGHNDYRKEPAVKAHVRRGRDGQPDTPPPPAQPEFRPRRRMVSWFDPRLLAMTGFNAVSAEFFRTYLDKREIEVLLTKKPPKGARQKAPPPPEPRPLQVDYVADLGDAFDPTYAIAWHLAKERLEVQDEGGQPLKLDRGRFLIMGGDQVYPAPTRERYLNQTVGPYSVALPGPPTADAPQLFALPGNHDWYDGLSLFLKQFCGEPSIGGWKTPQWRSYFAFPLDHDWWLLGVDAGLGGQIDAPQRLFFERLPIEHGSRVILCWSVPTWTKEPRKPGGHAILQEFVKEVVEKTHHSAVRLYLTGDSHHFAHHESLDTGEHWITAGGGGAFLHPTHNLRDPQPLPATDGHQASLRLRKRWPNQRASRNILWGLLLFPRRNPAFVVFTAIIHALLAWGVQGGVRAPDDGYMTLKGLSVEEVVSGFIRNPLCIFLGALVVLGFTALAIPPRRRKRHRYRIAGAVHGFLHVGLAVLVTSGASTWLSPKTAAPFTVAFVAKAALAGGVLSGVLVGLYLAFTNLAFKMHDNEAFSALHLTGYKHFLRMEIAKEEVIVRVIGLKKVGRRWKRVPATADRPPCARPSEVKPTVVHTIHVPARPQAAPPPEIDLRMEAPAPDRKARARP
jgi:hypothetical protein